MERDRFEQEQRVEREGRPPDADPHEALNNPVGEPDPTEWPDPYETSDEEPRDPHPSQDPESRDDWKPPERDNLDD